MNVFDELVESFSRLPGIGKKSAVRITNFILKTDSSFAKQFAGELATLHEKIKPCKICGSYTENEICSICESPVRDRSVLCVVEQPQDVQTIEESREYKGLFHVLGGVISPLDGIGPDQLSIAKMLERIHQGEIKEVILATNPTVEGDTTALYIQRLLSDTDICVTRLASGLPVGGDLEYADKLTLARSFRGRTKF